MDGQNLERESRQSGSFGRVSSRRFSLSMAQHCDDAIESESVSEAGDIGDRALHSNRVSHFSLESGAVFPIADENLLQSMENLSPLSVDAEVQHEQKKIDEKEVPWLLEHITCLLSLAVFGILGVVARYGLQKLFGPEVVGATSDTSYMYPDLPSNMVGSFLMGWFGVVFKADILKFSNQLAIGLSTGFLGSLTTFSGWNQKMLDLSVKGQWVFAVLGIFIGLFLVAYSIIFGIETAKGLKWLYSRSKKRSTSPSGDCFSHNRKCYCLLMLMVMLLLMLALLWSVFGILARKDFDSGSNEAQLFLACMVGPLGVWTRWYLARLNGRGLGKKGMLKWMPFGTLVANVVAACVMGALALLKKAVKSKDCNSVASGIQLGLLGCLSTVSTFIAEFNGMRESKYPWRAYAYAAITLGVSFVLGTLIYSVPVWVTGYN